MIQKLRNLTYKVISKVIPQLLSSELIYLTQTELFLKQGYGWGTSTVSHEIKAVANFLDSATAKSPTIFDIGANIGDYSKAALNLFPNSTIVCFEPNEKNSKTLMDQFTSFSNVKIVGCAVGKENGRGLLFADYNGGPLGSLTKRNLSHMNIDFSDIEEIEIITLDDWSRINNIHPDIIKIDVEGHELDVLWGGIETVKSSQVVQFEFGGANIDTRTYFLDFFNYFKAIGFIIYVITPRGTKLISAYSERCEFFSTTNFIAVPAT